MEFSKYQSLARYGTKEVAGINKGTCHIFPKLDGTNASVWLDEEGNLQAGSRNRTLTLQSDNAGFLRWLLESSEGKAIERFLRVNPLMKLYGEWLVPHTLKTYEDEAWRQFYVFDVVEYIEGKDRYIHYDIYSEACEFYGVKYIPRIKSVDGFSEGLISHYINANGYLVKEGIGEGIVIKNYSFENKYGRTVWAKIVSDEFAEMHGSSKATVKECVERIETKIAEKFVTQALCDKTYAKIELELENEGRGFKGRDIPKLLNTVYYDVVREDMWEIIKQFKNVTINFKHFQSECFRAVRLRLPNLF